ncbi:MAG: putative structural protein [Prokaryotic dsDNA virus sp.]|nr:MAG: putative structural protein [Prokaryotic dsDNA virus sp.]|tara:strand:- start:31939 stop:33390 length:1452 start_codon:yes stop_codon:yes gene_type:complete
MSVLATPGFDLQPSAQQVALASNYITNFDFLNQYLPDTYEKEFERYGNRTVASFLRMVGAEMPSNSDLIKWAEQGRLHTKYTACTLATYVGNETTQVITIPATQINPVAPASSAPSNGFAAIRVGQTIMISDETAGSTLSNKAIVTANSGYVAGGPMTITVAYYELTQAAYAAASTVSIFIYGSEFKKGTAGMSGSLEAQDFIFDNSPIIIKDTYEVNGSDMAQIGWVEISTENGGSGYLWYMKSEHETRLRFEDYLETAMVEAVPAAVGSGAAATTGPEGNKGSEGVFYVVNNRGNVWSGGNPVALAGFDAVIQRLDKQGSIEENVIFVNRDFSFDIDDMLAAQNSYGAGGTSYGLFDNDEEMALNLGFTGFRRGYDFYKSDWKYLNDPTMRGGLTGGKINGLMVPAGSTTVYDQILGKNAKRPFLHVRYRASETEDRRYKTWITGSAGGARTSDVDKMQVNFLSERACCTLGANNFFLFQD